MAFEIIHSPSPFSNPSPARSLAVLFLGFAAFLALIWCCDVAYHAKPLDAEQKRPAHLQRVYLDG
jgi:hypothetical protein